MGWASAQTPCSKNSEKHWPIHVDGFIDQALEGYLASKVAIDGVSLPNNLPRDHKVLFTPLMEPRVDDVKTEDNSHSTLWQSKRARSIVYNAMSTHGKQSLQSCQDQPKSLAVKILTLHLLEMGPKGWLYPLHRYF